jgi:multicomponent K+:H+ antiporter subunit A
VSFISIVLLPLLCAALPWLASASQRRRAALLAAVAPALALALLLSYWPQARSGEVLLGGASWMPALGVNLSFMLDGLGFMFALLVLAIGLLVILYAHYYLGPEDDPRRFFSLLLVFMGSMLGVVLADNLLLLVLFWECTSLSSFLLIGFRQHRAESRRGARMALTVTGAGGVCLLAGALLVGRICGTYELSALLDQRELLQGHPAFPLVLALVLAAVFTKSAQFPFHFWLPHAMAAPTPVSAYLHSATLVKAGVFLLARLHPLLSGNDLWFYAVSGTGLLTLVFAAWVALFQHDLKGLLAYSTISHLGLITLLFGLDTPLAVVAGLFHIVNHATFKASLFMAAGIIDHETGTRDLRRINGLARHMPFTATLVAVAAAAMAGVPLLNGFLSKEMLLARAVSLDTGTLFDWAVPVFTTLAGAFAVAYSLRLFHDVFFNGDPVGLARDPHEPPRWMRVPVEVLVVLCVVVGLVPEAVVGPLLAAAAGGVLLGDVPQYGIHLWHGFNLPLALSAVALACGVALYVGLQRGYDLHRYRPGGLSGLRAFDGLTAAFGRGATGTVAAVQNGSLQRYVAILVAISVLAAGIPALHARVEPGEAPLLPMSLPALAVWCALVAASIAVVVLHHRRLVALLATGAVGLLVSLVFLYFSAPDLALTQIAVEVVTVLLLVLALDHLPQHDRVERDRPRRWRDAGLAIAAGAGVSVLAWGALTRAPDSISEYFIRNSLPGGGGANVVNVIIVDFRGFDTLGEILVLAVAGLVLHALFDGVSLARAGRPASGWAADLHPLMLRLLAPFLLPFVLAIAVHLFIRGHNAPGGGFVAGLVASAGVLVLFMSHGRAEVSRALGALASAGASPGDTSLRLIAAGVLVAVATGIGAALIGYPFLTSAHGYLKLPVLGDIPLASAMGFDLGVLLVVCGATLLMLGVLWRLGETPAGPRPASIPEGR